MPPPSDPALDEAAALFALLAEPTRLRILRTLAGGRECTVGEIVEATGASFANVSQHLRRLAWGGVLSRRRVGKTVRYRIVDDTVESLCDLATEHSRRRARRWGPLGATARPGMLG